MPLTGDKKKDIPELMRKIRDKGTFGSAGHGKSKKKLRQMALAAAYSAERRKKKGRKSKRGARR
jgi:hypothetical protein